jgi:carbon monoxide dehydrogenase subunit G
MRAVLALITMLCASLAAPFAQAHGPTRQKAFETITIKASPDAVWAKVRDFAQLQGWHPAIESSTATNGSEVGSVRTLKIKGGGEVIETLESLDDGAKKFSYRAKDGSALPVTNYSSNLTVKAGEGGGALVEWRGAFYRKYMNNDPPKGEDDEAALSAITGVYKSGLANLKAIMEK